MDEADHVVDRAAHHRVARMRQVAGLLDRVAHLLAGIEEGDLGARHHDLAHQPGAGLEDLVEDPALFDTERLVSGHQTAQLLLGDRLLGGAGSPPSSRTTPLVETESSQMTGRETRAMMSSAGAKAG